MAYKWTNKETKLLLTLYMKYKQEFHGQPKRNTVIWQHIVREMEEHGISTSYIKLDRKFRNMKRTYNNIKRKNLMEAPNWEYFHTMDAILDGGSNQSSEWMSSEGDETVCEEEKIEIKAEPYDVYPHEMLDESNFGDIISDRATTTTATNEEQDVDVDSPYLNLAEELEVQRLEELRSIRIALIEANDIQRQRNQLLQERNDMMREFLSTRPK
ncbi:uncharacterized protein LOC132792863 [Drosophila nasuta]|uniref:Uncharacterized protein LOC117568359 n=1 Tax=Drosophila albomicans TaxID=7291 RepID=A0A6P8WMD2_DROAB|nr:uncharacterized protein LOC117568359 [Drosophila albomicans]XP_060658360.1 uncharacterized protein LOC132792863 [Drosophila nasuta]